MNPRWRWRGDVYVEHVDGVGAVVVAWDCTVCGDRVPAPDADEHHWVHHEKEVMFNTNRNRPRPTS